MFIFPHASYVSVYQHNELKIFIFKHVFYLYVSEYKGASGRLTAPCMSKRQGGGKYFNFKSKYSMRINDGVVINAYHES